MVIVDTSDIDAKIGALLEEKRLRIAKAEAAERERLKKEANILVRTTPTKAKPTPTVPPLSRPPPPKSAAFSKPKVKEELHPSPPLSKLSVALAARRKERAHLPPVPPRTTSLAREDGKEMPLPMGRKTSPREDDDDDLEIVRTGKERESDLTVSNELQLGPKDHGMDDEDNYEFRAREPNSGIRLKQRVLPHAAVQDFLYGRYYLRPSQIYSIGRLSRDGQSYDVPVEGDWVTIAVVAERNARVSAPRDVSDDEEDGDGKKKGKGKERVPKKYVNLKLVALPPRNNSNMVSGDAYLQLLLFESDSIVHDGEKNTYRGGSGGAYEKWCNLSVGSVIAILNPRVLRPLKAGAMPHPLNLPLALNPTSADSVSYIGRALDIGQCTAMRRDGNQCKDWVDLRNGVICDYHVHAAIKRKRGTRGEFASATTSFAQVTKNDGKYDPKTKTGLLPRNGPRAAPRGQGNGGGGATYIVGSGVARTGARNPGIAWNNGNLSEKIGRNQAEKRKRKAESDRLEEELERMGDRAVGDATAGGRALKALRGDQGEPEPERKSAFTASAIQRIGFDPTGVKIEDKAKRAEVIAAIQESIKGPKRISAFPVKRMSNVVVPEAPPPHPKAKEAEMVAKKEAENSDQEEDMIDLDDDDMIDLD